MNLYGNFSFPVPCILLSWNPQNIRKPLKLTPGILISISQMSYQESILLYPTFSLSFLIVSYGNQDTWSQLQWLPYVLRIPKRSHVFLILLGGGP